MLRERESLKRPILKRGEIYLFLVGGTKTLKAYHTRPATADEVESGISYQSTQDGRQKVVALRSLNPAFPEIVVSPEDLEWLGWFDKSDNP